MKIIQYKFFKNNEDFVIFQKENQNIIICGITPMAAGVTMESENSETMKQDCQADVEIGVFITYYEKQQEK